ncbi:MAG: hypothetical protein WD316_09020 [Phycisphaeraceae bacterium]
MAAEPAPPARPAAAASTDDPDALWAGVLARTAETAALSWVQYLQLVSIDEQRAVLAIRPGHRELRGFLTPARLQPIATLLRDLLGRGVRVDLQPPRDPATPATPAGPAAHGDQAGEASSGRAGADARASRSAPQARRAGEAHGDAQGGNGGVGGSGDRRQAMRLPLVRRVLETFPDAIVVDVRREEPAAPPAPPDADDDDGPDADAEV